MAVFWLAKPQLVLQAIQQADLRYILIGLFASITWLFIRAQVWRTLLRNRPSYTQAFFTTAEGYLLNNLLPFRLGEFARSLLMAQKIHISFWEVFSTVILERLLDIIFSVSVLVMALFFLLQNDLAWLAAAGVVAAVMLVLIAFFFLAQNRAKVTAWTASLTRKFPRFQKLLTSLVESFIMGLSVINEPKLFLKVLFWMLLNMITALLQYYFFLKPSSPRQRSCMQPSPWVWAPWLAQCRRSQGLSVC